MTTFNRKPIQSNCIGQPNNAAPAGIDDPCTMLPLLLGDLYAIMSGRATQQVRDGDRWKSFHNGNVVQLRQEIARLEKLCPRSATNPYGGNNHAVQVGPRRIDGVRAGFYPSPYRLYRGTQR